MNKAIQFIKKTILQISENKFKVTVILLLLLNLIALLGISSNLNNLYSEVRSIDFEVSSIQSDISSIESNVSSIYYGLR